MAALHFVVNPLGIEPRAKEPESFILSIKLRVRFSRCKNTKILFWSCKNSYLCRFNEREI